MQASFLSQLFEQGEDSDITIVCGEESIRAHRIILRSGCAFFQKMLSTHHFKESNVDEVRLKEDPKIMKAMIRFFYTSDYPDPEHQDDILMHARMHAAAPYYQAPLFENRTRYAFSFAIYKVNEYTDDGLRELAAAIKFVYCDIVPETTRALRETTIDYTANRLKTLAFSKSFMEEIRGSGFWDKVAAAELSRDVPYEGPSWDESWSVRTYYTPAPDFSWRKVKELFAGIRLVRNKSTE
ncbi:uncharacterized protein J3D65DRAFT_354495 [Phyllosticta citribraziliensis]|uniref:BTB domain-containing protein n=1 Tax=Phyllosticta citribraziliensis TaxID=989973 RepID=A0ABR1LNP7_9PEZI